MRLEAVQLCTRFDAVIRAGEQGRWQQLGAGQLGLGFGLCVDARRRGLSRRCELDVGIGAEEGIDEVIGAGDRERRQRQG